MEKRFTSLLLVIAMLATLFSGLTLTANAAEAPAGDFVLAGAIEAGDRIMFVYPDSTPKAAGAITSYNNQSQTYLSSADAQYKNSAVVSADALVFEVEAGTAAGTFAFKNDGKYLASTTATSGSNYVFLTATEKSAATDWNVTIAEGIATVSHPVNDTVTRYLKYNSGNPRFSCYVSGQKDIAIYKQETNGTFDSPEDIDVYFVDGTDSSTPCVFTYNSVTGEGITATSEDLTYPGDPQTESLGKEMNGHNFYKITLNPASVDTVVFNNGAGQFSTTATADHTAPLSFVQDAVAAPAELGGNDFVVYSVKLEGGVLKATKEADVYPAPKQVLSEPTCTEPGSTAYVGLRTGAYGGQEETPALGHAWDEGTVTKEATHRFAGEKLFTCTRCSATKTEEIPKLENPFVDVHEGDVFFNPVLWAIDEQITVGVDDTHFAPERTVMRADAMVFFWAANGHPAFTSTSKTFKDVKKKHWAYNAVMWAVEKGITGGTDAAGLYFSPSRTCTRSEILQFLYAAMGKPEYHIANPYSDVKTKHWYYDGAIWAYENGLEKGEDGKFKAKTLCTRGSVVTYLFRYFTHEELAE